MTRAPGRTTQSPLWLCVCLLALGGQGCVEWRSLGPWASRSVPCTLPPNISKAELVRHINSNTQRIQGWRSNDVQISVAGMPVKLQAKLAVESPKRLRLRAASIAGDEADLGSNDERFWFWMRRSKPAHVFTATHEQLPQLQQRMQLPFQPDWLMEALGVAPLNEADYTLLPKADNTGLTSLVSDRTTPAGQKVRRVILVDTCHGRVVAHELYDSASQLIARAELNSYKVDPGCGAALPHEISLDWPQAQMAMTMHIRTIDVNPAGLPEQTWQLPQLPGYPVFDIGALAGNPQSPPGRAKLAEDSPFGHPRMENGLTSPVNYVGAARTAQLGNDIPEFDGVSADAVALSRSTPMSTGDEPPWDASSSKPAAMARVENPDWAAQPPGKSRFSAPPGSTTSSQLPAERTSAPPWWGDGNSQAEPVTPIASDESPPFLPPINRGLRP